MSARTKRRRPPPGQTASQPAAQPAAHQPVPMPKWNWRTFPVYFAFSLGGFLGVYMGLIAGSTDNSTVYLVVLMLWAILLGFGFSRLTTRFMISRNWGPAARRARKR